MPTAHDRAKAGLEPKRSRVEHNHINSQGILYELKDRFAKVMVFLTSLDGQPLGLAAPLIVILLSRFCVNQAHYKGHHAN